LKMVLSLPEEDEYYAEKEVRIRLPATFRGPDSAIVGDIYSGVLVDSDNHPLAGKTILLDGVAVATTNSDGSFRFTVPGQN